MVSRGGRMCSEPSDEKLRFSDGTSTSVVMYRFLDRSWGRVKCIRSLPSTISGKTFSPPPFRRLL